jgi:hypothetical protein
LAFSDANYFSNIFELGGGAGCKPAHYRTKIELPEPALPVQCRSSVPSPNCRPSCRTLLRQFKDKGTLADSRE